MDHGVVHRPPDANGGKDVPRVEAGPHQLQAAAVDEEQVRALAHLQGADVRPAQEPGPAPGGHLQQVVARGGTAAVGQAVEEVGHAQLLQQAVAVVAGAAVQGQPQGHPQLQHVRHTAHAGGQLHVAGGTVGHAGAGLGQEPQLLIVEVDAVGVPDVLPHPPQFLQEGQGPHPLPLQHVPLLIFGLAQVGVEADAVLPGQSGALPQQILADGEGGAGGQDHLAHGPGPGVVVGLDGPDTVGEDLVDGLDHAVGGQAPVLAAQIHAAPGADHPHPQGLPGGELLPQQVPAALGEDVVVVEAGGAPLLHHLPHGGEGGEADRLPVQVLPDLVQGPKPVEQLQPLHLGQVPGEALVQVVVGVHKARVAQHPGTVDDLVGLGGQARPHLLDQAVPAEDVGPLQAAVRPVAGDGEADISQQQRGHGALPFLSGGQGPAVCSDPAPIIPDTAKKRNKLRCAKVSQKRENPAVSVD